MIESTTRLSVIMGGYHYCTPAWNAVIKEGHHYRAFMFYLPVSGSVRMETTAGAFDLSAGNIYFIPAHHLLKRTVKQDMALYWVGFGTDLYYLQHRLMAIKDVHGWPLDSLPGVGPVFMRFPEYFDGSQEGLSRRRGNAPVGLGIQIEGVLVSLVGALVERTESKFSWDQFVGLERLKPAINFMDENYLRNPSMSEIAQQINLTTAYFHRAFKRETGLTPFKYMENRRLDTARKLLFEWRLNVTEVAREAGYENVCYFTRIFHRRFGIPPSQLRRAPRGTVA